MVLFIDPRHLTPLEGKEPEICMRCLQKRARWRVGQDGPYIQTECSFCILRKTEWGRQNKFSIMKLVAAVEQELGRKISDEDGLVLEEEADRILVAIRQTSAAKIVFEKLRNR